MKMFCSKSHQEINSELSGALVSLKLTRQLEKVLQRPCCFKGTLCFSAPEVKQIAQQLWANLTIAVRLWTMLSFLLQTAGLFYDADEIPERWGWLVKLWNHGERRADIFIQHTPLQCSASSAIIIPVKNYVTRKLFICYLFARVILHWSMRILLNGVFFLLSPSNLKTTL